MLVVFKAAQLHLRMEETPSASLSKCRRQNDKGPPAAAVPLAGRMKSLTMLTNSIDGILGGCVIAKLSS